MPGMNGHPGKVNEFRALEEKMLFDLVRDPGERYNVIDMYPEKVKELENYAEIVRKDLGDNLTGNKGAGRRKAGEVQ